MILENWGEEAKQTVDNFSQKEKERLNAIIAMNIMVCNMNDESAYFTWIYLIPDCADEYDFIDFARMMKEQKKTNCLMKQLSCSRNCGEIMQRKKRLYIAGKTY